MQQEKINYVEWPAVDLNATRAFFETVFCWTFESFGANYIAFCDGAMKGGFYRAQLRSRAAKGGALVVLYSPALEATEMKVEQAGGVIEKPTFSFPGGRRFHFLEPSGNELAVWSDG